MQYKILWEIGHKTNAVVFSRVILPSICRATCRYVYLLKSQSSRVVALEMSFLFGISSQPFITRAITESLCCRPNLRPILVACCPCDAHRLWSSATICGFFYVSLLKSFFSYRSIIDMFSFHKNLKMSSYMKFFIHIWLKRKCFWSQTEYECDNIIMREIN